MANYIITKNKPYFEKIGKYNYCDLEDMILTNQIAIDLETTGLSSFDDDMFSVQIGTGKNNYLIDLQDYSSSLFPKENLYFKQVIPYLTNKVLIGHNLKFDMSFFYKNNFYPDLIFDTMIASQIYYNGDETIFSHSLGKVMERELKVDMDKSEQKNIYKVRLSTPLAIEYCFNDVDRLLELHDFLFQKLRTVGSIETYFLNCEFLKSLVYMERCGIPLDKKMWLAKMENDKKLSSQHKKTIIEYIYDNIPKFRDNQLSLFDLDKKVLIQISSPKQMIKVFQELKIPCKNDEGKDSIKEDVIDKSGHEFVELWLKYQEAEHNVTTFGEKILNKSINDRLYTQFKPMVNTCRIATRTGEINFLNFPANENTRDCFKSGPGYKMVAADYEGQENVCSAMLTRDEAMLDSLNKGFDLHCMFARVIFPEIKDLTDKQIKNEHSEKRNFSKAPRFLFSYGGSAHTLHTKKNIPKDRATEIEKGFKSLHATMFAWGEEKLKESIKTGYIQYTYGFRLKLPFFSNFLELHENVKSKDNEFWEEYKAGRDEHKALLTNEENIQKDSTVPVYVVKNKSAYSFYKKHAPAISKYFSLKSGYLRLCLNAPSQGMAAHMTKKAMIMLFNIIKNNGHIGEARICNMVHDEIVMEVRDDLVDQYEDILKNVMIEAANSFLDKDVVSMKCDAFGGYSWYSAKKAKEKFNKK